MYNSTTFCLFKFFAFCGEQSDIALEAEEKENW